MMLSDNETKVDLLNSEAIAITIVKLLREKPDRPITIGVHGDWGAGKSSVLEMIEHSLASNDKVLCIKFNGWRYQGFEDSKIALLEAIVTELIEKRSLLTKAAEEVKDILGRIDLLKVAKKAGGLLLTAATGIPSGAVVDTFVSTVKSIISDPAKLANKDNLDALSASADSILKPKDVTKNIPKEIKDFRKAFDKLLEKANVEQLIVLVDDLDRCLPDTAIETLEAIRLFVFTNKTAFVIAADEAMIEYAVRKHFPDLPESTGYQAYTRNYLEKLIQVPFRIPILGELETRMYVSLLLIASSIGEDDEGFNKLIAAARESLKKPWEGAGLDVTTLQTHLGTGVKDAKNALLISDQIGPILASGTKGNPRQIKRFLNTLILRQLMAEARGFGDSILLPVLAKLMIAERFLPRLFEQIASISANSKDGKCLELKVLEQSAKEDVVNKPDDKDVKKRPKKDMQESIVDYDQKIVAEWLASEEVGSWNKIQTQLSDIDLRPYIFVAKDKKDFFNVTVSLGDLSNIVEKLMGPKFVVQSVTDNLRVLSNTDANKIFDAIRARIIGSDMKTEPAGIIGLSALVKHQGHLQIQLMDFLESLPVDKLGAWVVKGWESVFTEPDQKSRLEKLMTTWGTNTVNPILKTVVNNTKKIK